LCESDLATALAARERDVERRHAAAKACAASASDAGVASVASAIRACYGLGERDIATTLAASTPGVYAFDEASAVVLVACHYRSRGFCVGGALEVEARRKP